MVREELWGQLDSGLSCSDFGDWHAFEAKPKAPKAPKAQVLELHGASWSFGFQTVSDFGPSERLSRGQKILEANGGIEMDRVIQVLES